MKIVKASHEWINDKEFDNPLQKIERIARICYKSEDKITEDSYKKMIENLVSRKHYAMLEHASLCFAVSPDMYDELNKAKRWLENHWAEKRQANYYRINETREVLNYYELHKSYRKERFVVSANIRTWLEFFEDLHKFDRVYIPMKILYQTLSIVQPELFPTKYDNVIHLGDVIRFNANWIRDISKLTDAERLVHETFTVIFTCDRGVTHELVRMRDASFAQESTRYCNYQLGKYNSEITVVEPLFFVDDNPPYDVWKRLCEASEEAYMGLRALGIPAQQARTVLPQSVKADIAVTANLKEWRHIFELRACDLTGPAHPQMKEIMIPTLIEVKEKYPAIAFGDLTPAE